MLMATRGPIETVYVAGRMRGLPAYNVPSFLAARESLRAQGYEVVLPHDILAPTETDVAGLLAEDIRLILDVDAVVVLPQWYKSEGASFEVYVAHFLGKPILDYKTLQPVHEADLPQHNWHLTGTKKNPVTLQMRELERSIS